MSAATAISLIPLNLIDEDISNHRIIADPGSDRQLVASIRANGVQQPIKICSKPGGRFTLVFGFRRKAAAAEAGLTAIPAIVEQGLDQNTIRQLQAIENLERRELHPMEEAQFCADLADAILKNPTKHDSDDLAEAIAQRIGRGKKWVELRLCMARLSERVKQAFMAGDIHLQHAQLIARLVSHDAQEEVLGYVQAHDPTWLKGREREEARSAPSTIAETRRLVEQRLRDLDTVTWKLDATFADLPACSGCPHNSANRLDLFDGDQPKKPQCLDASCYAAKNKAASRAVVKATNTAIKETTTGKITPTVARRAIGDREVPFIRDQAVVEAAKRRQKPDEPTTAERRGQSKWEKQHQQMEKVRVMQYDWANEFEQAIAEKLPTGPLSVAMLVLMSMAGLAKKAGPCAWLDEAEQKEGQHQVDVALDILTGTNGYEEFDALTRLYKMSQFLAPIFIRELRGFDLIDANANPRMTSYTANALIKRYGIEMPLMPTEADLEEEKAA